MYRVHFSQRIVIAFVLMTVLVSGAFSLGIVRAVHFVENYLVSQDLHGRLTGILREEHRASRPPKLDSRTRFFASNSDEFPIPDRFSQLSDGLTEIEDATNSSYAYLLTMDGVSYLLVQDQQEFETREEALFHVVLAGFILCVAGAWVLGLAMSSHVMKPVARLAAQVRSPDQGRLQARALSPDYADDEIGQLASAFDSALGKLRLALDREQLFTSDVSHELRTPLMVISSSCELLAESVPTPRQREQIDRIARAAAEMKELVETFLLLAREEAAVSDGTKTAAAVAHELRERWETAAGAKNIVFELAEEGPDPTPHNPALLRTVMDNLLRNAVHYTAEGTVRLTLGPDGFRVEDTGEGIPADEHDRIFSPFMRGSTAHGEGLGLGLSLARRICAHQGWEIDVKRRPTGGSCFTVTFHPRR